MTEDSEARLRSIEIELATLKTQVAPLLGVHALLSHLSNQVTELKGELKAMRGQAVVLGAVATLVAPAVFAVAMKLLHLS